MRIRVFRWDPSKETRPRYDSFEIVPLEKMSVLDALMTIQAEMDPTLSFRHSCRAGMCGTCAMMVNGIARWTCRTSLASLNSDTITLEPLRHFPVVRDLTTDTTDFFSKYRQVVPHVSQQAAGGEPLVIKPGEEARVKIADHLECIGCGCCHASCGLLALDPHYLGPHALNRVYTLIHDRRDVLRRERLEIVDSGHGCWRCHTQTTCTQTCPKEINTTKAIADLKRQVLAYRRDQRFVPEADLIPDERAVLSDAEPESPVRRELLHASVIWMLGIMAVALAVPLGVAALSPARKSGREDWIEIGAISDLPVGKMVEKRYRTRRPDETGMKRTVYLLRRRNGKVQALSPSCTHLGCPVQWVESSRSFICPCHGGIFDESGGNVGGPPKRPLDRLAVRIENDRLYLRQSS